LWPELCKSRGDAARASDLTPREVCSFEETLSSFIFKILFTEQTYGKRLYSFILFVNRFVAYKTSKIGQRGWDIRGNV
jgi:cAMP phosphodiesterase